MAYRYSLLLRDAEGAGDILRILKEISVPLRYLLLVPARIGGAYRVYLGLGSPDVLDLPVRLTACGIEVQRGEKV